MEFNKFLGLDLISQNKTRVVGRLSGQPHHLTGPGRIHGGALMAFADALAAHGTVLNLDEGQATATIESKTNFLRRAEPGELIGEALPLHIGRTTMVWQTTIRDGDERPVAIVTQTQLVLEARGSGKPDHGSVQPATSDELVSAEIIELATSSEPPPGGTAERRRAQIFEAALRLIGRQGFGKTSMREIAQAAGMPVPTMYQYVRSKDEILGTIFDSYVGAIEESIQATASGRASATDKLMAAIDANLAGFDRYQNEIRIMNRETASLQPEVRARVKQHMMGYIGIFRKIVEEGIERGEFAAVDADLVANLILMLCETWPLRQWSVGSNGLDAVKAAIQRLVLRGVTKEAAAHE